MDSLLVFKGPKREQEEEEERRAHRLVRHEIIAEGKEGGKRAKARLYPPGNGDTLSASTSLFSFPRKAYSIASKHTNTIPFPRACCICNLSLPLHDTRVRNRTCQEGDGSTVIIGNGDGVEADLLLSTPTTAIATCSVRLARTFLGPGPPRGLGGVLRKRLLPLSRLQQDGTAAR